MIRNKRMTVAAAALVIFIITALAYTTGTGGTLHYIEYPLRDALGAKSVWQREPNTSIKLIKIDSKSLEAVGQFPWDRSVYARLIERLANGGARAIGLDVMMPEPSKDPEQDRALAEMVAKYNQVVLPVNFSFPAKQQAVDALEYERIEVPAAVIGAHSDQLAHVNVFPDRDLKVRRLIVGLPEQGGGMVEAFSVKLANFALSEREKVRWEEEERRWYKGDAVIPVNARNQVMIQYYSSPRQEKDLATGYDAFSFVDVLEGRIDGRLFENDIVLIGPYATGLQDEYMTPMSNSVKMYGVEIHANMVQSILDNKFWNELPKPWGIALMAALSVLAALLFDRLRSRAALLAYAGAAVVYVLAFIGVSEGLHLYMPIVYPLLALTLAYLYSIVSHYIAERRERNRVTGMFGRFVPKAVVDHLLSSGEEVRLGGQRMDISVMFVDIRGFTTLSEKLEPEQVIQFLNEYLDVCTKAVFQYNGTLDKFIGDGVMAIFGAPVAISNHAEAAVLAALEMKRQTAAMEARLMERLGFTVRFGVGIHCGPAIVGNIGSEALRLDYTAIGDTVNLAARLESNAKPGQILISKALRERIGEAFEVTCIGDIKVKGKELPVTVYEVVSETSMNDSKG